MKNPFRCFKTSPEIIRLAVLMYVRYPLSLRQVEDLLHERGIDNCHETVRAWWTRLGPLFAKEIRKRRIVTQRNWSQWRWHLDEVFVRILGRPDSSILQWNLFRFPLCHSLRAFFTRRAYRQRISVWYNPLPRIGLILYTGLS